MNTAKNALGRSPLRRGRVCYEAAATSAPTIPATYLAYRPLTVDLHVAVFDCDCSIEVFGGPSLCWDRCVPPGLQSR